MGLVESAFHYAFESLLLNHFEKKVKSNLGWVDLLRESGHFILFQFLLQHKGVDLGDGLSLGVRHLLLLLARNFLLFGCIINACEVLDDRSRDLVTHTFPSVDRELSFEDLNLQHSRGALGDLLG